MSLNGATVCMYCKHTLGGEDHRILVLLPWTEVFLTPLHTFCHADDNPLHAYDIHSTLDTCWPDQPSQYFLPERHSTRHRFFLPLAPLDQAAWIETEAQSANKCPLSEYMADDSPVSDKGTLRS